ncbi:hypothetical protein T11_11305, partial [Trichinella zimbabwensis]
FWLVLDGAATDGGSVADFRFGARTKGDVRFHLQQLLLIIFCSLSKLLASSRFWLVLDGAATDGGSVADFRFGART